MGAYVKDDIDRWFEYSYLPSKRLIHLGSHTPEVDSGEGESGTDCQMSEFFIKAITHLNSISKKLIVVHMNNLGGDWYHGMAIYDAIRASKSHVCGVCWGYAMSMGSIIAQACDTRIVSPSCCFMIHDGTDSFTGTPKSFAEWARISGLWRKRMYEIYRYRMKEKKKRITIKQIEDMCSHDTAFTAKEAVAQGLADWVLETLEDPYKYYATETQDSKWEPGMELGKHKAETEGED